jgi:hypothetical protein
MPDTPDTLAYLIFGLVIGFGIIGGYLTSLYLRFQNVRRDVETLQQLED